MPCSRIQRRRARATSARSCSAARRLFFERDLVSSEKPPERGAAAGDPPLAHRDKHLVERQIRLFRDQGEQPIRPLLQWRIASSLWYGHGASGIAPALKPFDRRTGADLKMFGSLAPRSTALNSCDDALSKFHRIRVWHCSTSKSGINANRLAHKQPLGNPSILLGTFRFYSAETCSRAAATATSAGASARASNRPVRARSVGAIWRTAQMITANGTMAMSGIDIQHSRHS